MKEQIYKVIATAGIWTMNKIFPEYFATEPLRPTDRYYEYPFALNIIDGLKKNSRILDVGCVGSKFPLLIKSLNHEVYGIDIRPCNYDGIDFTLGSIAKTKYVTGCFDAVTAISTIEHIGLKRYGSAGETDKQAINEIHRILRKHGVFILTVPYGEKYKVCKFHRIYDSTSLKYLLQDFSYTLTTIKSPEDSYKIAMVKAIK